MRFEVGVREGFGPLPGRRRASVDLKPELEIPVDGINFLFTWLLSLLFQN